MSDSLSLVSLRVLISNFKSLRWLKEGDKCLLSYRFTTYWRIFFSCSHFRCLVIYGIYHYIFNMTARDKIDDAKYLLALLKDKNDRTEVRALLSGLLAIIRSIPDHLLEEYNTKLALNISLSEELRIKTFCCKAIQLNNSKAISFINSYMKEIQILNANPLWKIVKKKRDINIHRKDIPLKEHSHRVVSIPPLKIDVSSKAIARDKEGNIKNNIPMPQPEANRNTNNEQVYNTDNSPRGGVTWFFDDEPTTDIVTKFSQLLKDIQDFVDKIESGFP